MEPMTPEVVDLLQRANPAVLATVDPRSHPVSVTTWYTFEDQHHILLSIMTQGARGGRLDHLRTNPHVSLTVMDAADWTNAVNVRGTVTEFFADHDLAAVDEMARRHLVRPFAARSPRPCARVEGPSWEHPRRRW